MVSRFVTRIWSFVFLEKECKEVLKKRIATEAAIVFTTYNSGRLIALRDQLVRRRDRLRMRAAADANIDIDFLPPPPPPVTPNTNNDGNGGGQEGWVEFEQLPVVGAQDPQQNAEGEAEDEMDQVD